MSDLYLYMFRSRNKDNKDLSGFSQRTKMLLEKEQNEDKVRTLFEKFSNDGLPGEMSRLYRSVNSRNEQKLRDAVAVRLIKDKPDMTKITNMVMSVAAQSEIRDENKWMFDFDINNAKEVEDFANSLRSLSGDEDIIDAIVKTPNGFAVVVKHGLDTRWIHDKYADNVTLKKDDMLFLDAKVSNKEKVADLDFDEDEEQINDLW